MSPTREGRQNDEGRPAADNLAILPPRNSPRLQRRRLGNEIRRLREAGELSIGQVASHLYCSHSKISRIEAGQVSATVRDVRDIIDFCGVNKKQREALLQLAQEARQKAWWHAYRGIPSLKAYVSYEAAAASLYVFEAMVVPGLLQVRDYARTVIRELSPKLNPHEVEHRLKFRMTRQSLLTEDEPPEYRVIVDEAALRRVVGDHLVMRKQLRHLVGISALSNVTLQVLPFTAGRLISITGGFTILGFFSSDDPEIVYVEHTTGDLYFDGAEQSQQYKQMFDRLQAAALTPEESVAFLIELLKELKVLNSPALALGDTRRGQILRQPPQRETPSIQQG